MLREHWPASVSTTTFGQMRVGFSLSITVTTKLLLVMLPAASAALQTTGVMPLLKVVPEGGLHVAVTPGQLSLAVEL